VLSDLQIPFEAPKALEFCRYVQRHFRIDLDHILCVGDEVDQYFGSLYKKSCDADMSAIQEIKITKDKLKRWVSAFPRMLVAESNHGMRWAKKAAEAEIPSQMIRAYQEVLGIPETWRYARKWLVDGGRQKFILKHGLGYGGMYPFKTAPITESRNVVFGHLHSSAGIARIKTDGYEHEIWGMNVGCLIDVDSFAFHYGVDNKFKPNLAVGVVVNGGTTPMLLPYDVANA